MIQNEATYQMFRPDLEHPTEADFAPASQAMNALPIPWVDPGGHQQRSAVPGLRRG
jgi:(+)-trans-carveol dehydrogenase/(-)-trans-carveol dehydrogenase